MTNPASSYLLSPYSCYMLVTASIVCNIQMCYYTSIVQLTHKSARVIRRIDPERVTKPRSHECINSFFNMHIYHINKKCHLNVCWKHITKCVVIKSLNHIRHLPSFIRSSSFFARHNDTSSTRLCQWLLLRMLLLGSFVEANYYSHYPNSVFIPEYS